MLKIIIMILAGVYIFASVSFFTYCLCKMAGRADDQSERMMRKAQEERNEAQKEQKEM